MAVRRITKQEFEDNVGYLTNTAGVSLRHEGTRAVLTDDRNPAKVIEELEEISRMVSLWRARSC